MKYILSLLAAVFGADIIRICLGLGIDGAEGGKTRLKTLVETRGKVLADIDAILEKPAGEDGELSKEQREKHDALEKWLAKLDADIATAEKSEQRYKEQKDLEARAKERATPRMVPDVRSGFSQSERRDIARFSIPRVLSAMVEGRAIDGVEAEMLQEGNNETRGAGINIGQRSVMIPSFCVLAHAEQRSMTATGGTGLNQGGMTIAQDKAPLLDDLFNRNVLVQGGMTTYMGLVGNLDIPRLKKGTDPAHKAENAAADGSSPKTAQLSLTPKRLPVYVDISRQLFIQSQERNLETTIRRHIIGQLNEIIQRALINGGGGTSPRGILQTTGIGNVPLGANGAALTWADIVELETKVALEDADLGSLHYLTNAKVRGKLKSTAKYASTDSYSILDDRAGGMLNGYEPLFTNGVPSNLTKGTTGTNLSAIIFGNFIDLVMAQWSGIEFIVDDLTQATTGMIRLHAAIYYDGGVQRPESFAAATDVVTA